MDGLLLIITLAGERVAIRADAVESVVEVDGLTPVPRAAGHVAGLAALRSRVLTVIDSRASLELPATVIDGAAEAIVIEAEGHPYALLVDGVEDVFEYEGEVQPIRTSLDSGWRRVAQGMVEADGAMLLLVDSHALLAGPATLAA